MSNYKEALKQKLRVATDKGNLSVEQLWDLSLPELDHLAVGLEAAYKESGKKSFLVKKSKKDKTTKLMFDIVVDVLTTKVEEASNSLSAQENKAHNQHILGLIAEKENAALGELTIEELEAKLK